MKEKWIYIVMTCFVSCGLPYCKKTHLSDEELAWVNHYNKNDTILYYNNQTIDTMIVVNVKIDNKESISIFDLKSCNWLEGQHEYNAGAIISFKMKHNFLWWNGDFAIQKNQDQQLVASVGFGGLYSEKPVKISISDLSISFTEGKNAHQGLYQDLMGITDVKWDKKGLNSFTIKDKYVFKRKNHEK